MKNCSRGNTGRATDNVVGLILLAKADRRSECGCEKKKIRQKEKKKKENSRKKWKKCKTKARKTEASKGIKGKNMKPKIERQIEKKKERELMEIRIHLTERETVRKSIERLSK